VTFAEPTTFASNYETLRSRALEDGRVGGHFGLVILMREGVAAWMRHAAMQPATVTHVAAKDVLGRTPPIPDGLRADVALVLANMLMTTHEERCA
jgi:hypothetical protein